MPAEPTTAEKLRRLPFVMGFDALNSMFCNLSVLGSIFILFLSAMGLNKSRIGLVQSLVLFCGVVSVFMAPVAARLGPKRVFITFWASRNVFALAILATPWIFATYGYDWAFLFVLAMMACFSMCRSLAEAASSLWRIEIIPNSIRGRFAAANNIIFTLTAVVALSLAGFFLGDNPSLGRFVWVMGAGSALGIASLFLAGMMPGGGPIGQAVPLRLHFAKMTRSLRDRNFLLYLCAVSLVTFGSAPLGVFIPLFLKEQVGLNQDTIVKLPNGALVGTLVASYFWGWAADRFGSKPVILTCLLLSILPPLGWMFIPLHHSSSVWIACAIFVVSGIAGIGYGLGTSRQLYVTLVPGKFKTQYMAVYCAWMGVAGGLGQVLAGLSMDLLPRMSGNFLFLQFNDYTPLFLFSIAMLLIGWSIQRAVRADDSIPVGKFVSMFLQGNPLMAVESLLRYNLAHEDGDRVRMIKRLGHARSPLSVDELTDALVDPSFGVRYEAIAAIARTRKDPALTAALVETLISGQPDLSVAAAWALGRVGDPAAAPVLRWAFQSNHPLLQLRAGRALASMGDRAIIPEVRQRLAAEPDSPFATSYASLLRAMESGQPTSAMTQRLREAARPRLEDVIETLADGDSDARLEAVVLSWHCRQNDGVTTGLVRLLEQGEADLRIEAAWALARIGDGAAVGPLRRALASGFPLLRARSARALACLGDRKIVPELTRLLAQEPDIGVQLAYASALGELGATEAAGDMLSLQDSMPNSIWMSELNLALARLAGDERFFIRLWRQMRNEPGTPAAQAMDKCLKRMRRGAGPGGIELAREASQAFARHDLAEGGRLLARLIGQLPSRNLPPSLWAILQHCAARLDSDGWQQAEILPLAIHALHHACQS